MDGGSRMTIDPRIPTMPGRSRSGFHRPGRHCSRQARRAERCPASRTRGELHPTTVRSAFEADSGNFRVLFGNMNDSVEDNLFAFRCGHSQKQQ